MKIKTKPIAVAGLSAICALTLFAGAGMLARKTASAEEAQAGTVATNYFYDNLVTDANGKKEEYTLAKKFYKAFEEMYKAGDFKDGKVEYNVTENGIASSEQIKAWIENGNLTVPKAFSAARDSFLTDYPEVFYIDFYKLTLSAGRTNGVYTAFIDCGREANAYRDGGFTSEAEVDEAIAKFDAKIEAIANEALEAQKKDTYSEKDVYLARYVNNYLAQNIEYDYVAYDNKDDENYVAAAYINTAYGGLVEGKAVCGGFSTAYKAVMDKLEIPCITVNGYSNQQDADGNLSGSSVYHMWNYVWLENPVSETVKSAASTRASNSGEWYSVDVTWNSNTLSKDQYSVLGKSADDRIHLTDGVISSSGYSLSYPALSSHNYGASGETEGLQSSFEYVETGKDDDYGNPLVSTYATVSYNGKGAKKLLEEDGLYLVYRYAAYVDKEIKWFDWIAISPYVEWAKIAMGLPDEIIRDTDTETRFYENTAIYYMQFAVFDAEPDVPSLPIHSESFPEHNGEVFYYSYTANKLDESKSVEMGKVEVNKSYGTYTPPPYIHTATPTQNTMLTINDGMRDKKITDKVIMAENRAFTIELVYDEPLHVLDPDKPIGAYFTSEHPSAQDYAVFFPINANGDLVELVARPIEVLDKDGNVTQKDIGLNTLRFKFGPSLMYAHNRDEYCIGFTNVGSAKIVARKNPETGEITHETSDKAPNPAYYGFDRAVLACPRPFNYDGRLWVDCCAQPELADNSDLSATNFLKEDGTSSFSENERSQMMLVAEKASDDTVGTMLDEIDNHDGINIGKNDIKSSETYDINLQICGRVPKIPDGSYVKIKLGFPEGYGPNDVGVTFKLFHRKHIEGDTYIIEEIPCVVTQFGIVATVTSFSPYMVAVVDADKATEKTVYASIEGKGGKLSADDGKIRSLKEGESYTYTIKPDSGYQIYNVKLNGKDVTDKVKDGKLTVAYSELDGNNELEIKYIADEAAERFAQNNIVETPKIVVNTPVGNAPEANSSDSNVVAIIVIVVAVVVILALAAVAIVLIVRKKADNY